QGPMIGESFHFHPYWPSLLATGAAVWLLFSTRAAETPAWWRWVWVGVLLLDLLAFSWPPVAVDPFESIYPSCAALEYLDSHREPRGRVLDLDRDFSNAAWGTPLGPGAPLAPIHRIEAVRGFNPLDVLRYKEYLQFLSGRDRALRGLSGVLMNP